MKLLILLKKTLRVQNLITYPKYYMIIKNLLEGESLQFKKQKYQETRRSFPDDTVHMFTTPPSFGTRGSLILDIAISSYSITRFSILFC